MIESLFGEFIPVEVYCWTFFYLFSGCNIYFGISGISIAVVRLIYIRAGAWLKYNFGEMKLLGLAEITIIVSTIVLTYMFGTETLSNRSAYNLCTGHNQNFQVIYLCY